MKSHKKSVAGTGKTAYKTFHTSKGRKGQIAKMTSLPKFKKQGKKA